MQPKALFLAFLILAHALGSSMPNLQSRSRNSNSYSGSSGSPGSAAKKAFDYLNKTSIPSYVPPTQNDTPSSSGNSSSNSTPADSTPATNTPTSNPSSSNTPSSTRTSAPAQPAPYNPSPSAPSSRSSNSGMSYIYSIPFKQWGSTSISLKIQGGSSASSVQFTANFKPSAQPTQCFGASNVKMDTTANGNLFMTTLTGSFSLSSTCELNGVNAILPGLSVLIISSVSVDGQSINIYSPCASTGCQDPGNGYRVQAYYADWAVYGKNYNPDTIPYDKLNHIMYAFMDFNYTTGQVRSFDANADVWGMTAISKALMQYPYLRANIAFGGANAAAAFDSLSQNSQSVSQFASQAVTLMRQIGFTGIDIDWEWWLNTGEGQAPAKTSLALMKAIRSEMDRAESADGKKYHLSYAVSGSKSAVVALQNSNNPNSVSDFWKQMDGLCDTIGIMNYDYHGGFSTGSPAYFMANYDFPNIGSNNVGATEGWSIKASVDAYLGAGVSPKTLIVGIPLYVRTLGVSASGNNGGIFQRVTGAGFGDLQAGILDYKCLINPVVDPIKGCVNNAAATKVQGLTQKFDDNNNSTAFNLYGKDAFQPWAYSSGDSSFATYENTWSVGMKSSMVKSKGLGGVMFWQLDGDAAGSQSLIGTATSTFSG